MKKMSLLCLVASTSFAYNGEEFFTNNASLFWEGTDSIRFQQSPTRVISLLNNNLKTIEEFSNRFGSNYKLSVWADTTSRVKYFLSNWPSKVDYQMVNAKKAGCSWDDVTLGRVGLTTVYVGNKDSNFVLMAFTFYKGSKEFRRNVKSEYAEEESVKGLFAWSINMEDFKQSYLSHVLEDVGYGRPCRKDVTINCQNKIDKGGYIVTKDKDVSINWHKEGNLLDIHLTANYVTSLPAALKTNLSNWSKSVEIKHPALD